MKICPKCNQQYDDDNLNFCLDDGTVLTQQNSESSEPPETVFINQPEVTGNNQPLETNANWQNSPINSPNIQNSSGGAKSWLWVIGILAVLVLFCGGTGIIGLAVIGSMDNNDSFDEENYPTPSKTDNKDNPNREDKPTGKIFKTINFSDINFKSDKFVTVDNSDGLEISTLDGYFYSFVFSDVQTYDTNTKVTATNESGDETDLGYGLVVQGDPKKSLSRGYAFVIRSDKGQYRVVRHRNTKESVVVNWKRSNAIKKGSKPNDLEVRYSDHKMNFYINGEFVETVVDTTRYKDGVAGVYTSDDVPIVFTDLEIWK